MKSCKTCVTYMVCMIIIFNRAIFVVNSSGQVPQIRSIREHHLVIIFHNNSPIKPFRMGVAIYRICIVINFSYNNIPIRLFRTDVNDTFHIGCECYFFYIYITLPY